MVIKRAAVYIMTNRTNTVLYVGVTTRLSARILEHIEGKYPKSFTHRYRVVKLIYYELYDSINEAIVREKQLKAGSRKLKIQLIEDVNPKWKDLYHEVKLPTLMSRS